MSLPAETVRLAGIVRESIVDGPGFRFTIFTQGCPHHCDGCHNPQTHPFEGGSDVTLAHLLDEIKKSKYLRGVTFSGGEPFCQAASLSALARDIHSLGLDIISYTGYTFEELLTGANEKNSWLNLLQNIDYLIDGKFILAQRSLMLKYRGSSNQRIIDVPRSLKEGRAVQIEL